MRQITINAIAGIVIGLMLPPIPTPEFWAGLIAIAVLIVNSMVPEERR